MSYMIGTGAFKVSKEWADIWSKNTQYSNVICLSDINSCHPAGVSIETINLRDNLGHIGQILNKTRQHEMCGWSASVLALAMISYANGTDFIYKEQDCLAFGDWIGRMYDDMGSGDIVFGRRMKSAPWMPCAQSLFLIRHRFLPDFVAAYIGMGSENSKANIPESKFCNLEHKFSPKVKRLSFGVDRERPLPWKDKVWYAQKWTEHELAEAKSRGMI